MSVLLQRPCICPADACFGSKGDVHCKHRGKVLYHFIRQRRRFACYAPPGTFKVGQHIGDACCVTVGSDIVGQPQGDTPS